MAVLAMIISGINFTVGRKLYSLMVNGLGVLIPIIFLIPPAFKYYPSFVKVGSRVYTIYLYITILAVIFLTYTSAVTEELDSKLIVFILDMWLYLLFMFFALYAFTSFTFNYDLVMGVAAGQTNHVNVNVNVNVNKTGHTAINQIEVKSNSIKTYDDNGLKNEDVENPEKQQKSVEKN